MLLILLKIKFLKPNNSDPYHLSSWIVGVLIILFNLGWTYVEIMQIVRHKIEYFKSFWNVLDIVSIALNVSVVAMEFFNTDYKNINRVSCISVLILYFKLFYFMRIFNSTAYLVRMIIEIVKDMKNFVWVLMIATMAFANAYYILGRNSSPDDGNLAGNVITDAFIFSYQMGIGNFQTDGFNTVDREILWIFFMINTLLVFVVLLNLVISIMGDTFDRVQETQELSKLRELTQMIKENEFIFSREKYFRKIKYIVAIHQEKAEGVKPISWEGKLNQLKNYIDRTSKENMICLAKFKEEMERSTSVVFNEKLKLIEAEYETYLSEFSNTFVKWKEIINILDSDQIKSSTSK